MLPICFNNAISRNVESGTPSSLHGTRTRFIATTTPGFNESSALKTVPYAPESYRIHLSSEHKYEYLS